MNDLLIGFVPSCNVSAKEKQKYFQPIQNGCHRLLGHGAHGRCVVETLKSAVWLAPLALMWPMELS